MGLSLHALATFARPCRQTRGSPLIHFLFHFGLAGLPIISAVDSSFVPLPIPGVTDILIIVYAASRANLFLLVALSTLGSAIGGYLSHAAGRAGGMAFLQKTRPCRHPQARTTWMEDHAILAGRSACAAAAADCRSRRSYWLPGPPICRAKKFMTAFVISRFVRHALAAWIGVHYGRHVIRFWNQFSAKGAWRSSPSSGRRSSSSPQSPSAAI